MKVKKLIASVMVVVVSLSVLNSFSAFADTITQKADYAWYNLNDYVINGDIVECDSISNNLTYAIADITGNNKGCKINLYFNYKSIPSEQIFDKQYAVMAINYKNTDTLMQKVELSGGMVSFDWDTILANSHWTNPIGLIQGIYIGTNADISLSSMDILVPIKTVKELSAGEPCKDLAVLIVR